MEALKLAQALLVLNILPFAVLYALSLVFNDLLFVFFYAAVSFLLLDAILEFFRPDWVRSVSGYEGPVFGKDTLEMLRLGNSHASDEMGIMLDEIEGGNPGECWFRMKRLYMERFAWAVKKVPALLVSKGIGAGIKACWFMLLTWKEFRAVAFYSLSPVLLAIWAYKGEFELPFNWFVISSLAVIVASGVYEALSACLDQSDTGKARNISLHLLLYAPFLLFKFFVKLAAVRDELAGEPRPGHGQD
ncbi:MAG: hypothetical protein WC481_05040 [Candidatus Omnitrophota bacterium]